MRIALVFPPFFLEPMYNMPPLGLINLATMLAAAGHHPRIFDFPLAIRQKTLDMGKLIYRDCADIILAANPDIAAFSTQCTTYPPALRIAREIKSRNPAIKIVFGGHNASLVDEKTLRLFPFVDAIVRGEGEIALPDLVSALGGGKGLQSVRGVTFREEDRVVRNADRELIADLDSLPLPDYAFVAPLSEYRDRCGIRRAIVVIEAGRGCPHQCIYCSQSLLWRRKARYFSADRLVGEMRNLSEHFGAECFLLAYDQFTVRRDHVEDFCRKAIDSGLNKIPWYCISRMDTVDAPLLKLMREAGCEAMCYGIDSGSERTLAFIRKKIDREILHQRVVETTSQGIVPTLSFVIGFPEETKEDLDRTLELALMAGAAGSANILVQMATILPGTDLQKNYSDLLLREIDTYFSLGIEFDRGKRLASDEDLIDLDSEVFSSFYNLPCPAASLGDLNLIAAHFSLIATLYPRSFLLLALELDESISELFLRFLSGVSEKAGRSENTLSPRECFDHFPDFAGECLDGRHLVREFLPDMLRYETACLAAGRLESSRTSFTIDLGRLAGFRPAAAEKVRLQEFTFEMAGIILDAKFGRLGASYPRAKNYILFRQIDGHLDTREINQFGADFLALCDGKKTLEEIAGLLQPGYGREMSRAEFVRSCAEAVPILADLGLILPEQPRKSEPEGGEIDAAG